MFGIWRKWISGLMAPVTSVVAFCLPVCPAKADYQRIRVALFIDRGTSGSTFRREFASSEILDSRIVNGESIRDGALRDFDALIVPGGAAKKESASMGPEAREEVRRFVERGGIYIGVCAGAYLASRTRAVYLDLIPLRVRDLEHWYRVNNMTRVDVELTQLGMEIFGIDCRLVRIGYENGPIFAAPLERPDQSLIPLGFFRSEVVGDGGRRGVMLGAPSMVLSRYGKGWALAISPHPEETSGMKMAEVHALVWLFNHRDALPPVEEIAQQWTESRLAQSNYTDSRSVNRSIESKDASDLQIDETPAPRRLSDGDSSFLSREALQLGKSIFEKATVVKYIHHFVPASRQITLKDDGTMSARTDCSGFISFIVHAVAPRHYRAVRELEPRADYPQAKIWASFFESLEPAEAKGGWLKIANWQELQPGDFIAWRIGKNAPPGDRNTGHVMMVEDKPGPLIEENGSRYFEISVLDSSTTYHFGPERLPPHAAQAHRDGLGIGTVRIFVSPDNQPIGYWVGTYWGEGHRDINGPTESNQIRFARMVPFRLKPQSPQEK